jgi:DNA replication protein DnaC
MREVGVNLDAFRCWEERRELPGFQNFDPDPDRHALAEAVRFARAFARGERPSLYLYSKRPGEKIATGGGKTHLAAACVRAALLDPAVSLGRVRFVYVQTALRRIQEGFANGQSGKILDRMIGCELLVLDDFGAHRWTEWTVATLTELVHARAGRSTIYTSNYSLDEVLGQATRARRDDEEVIARALSRIDGAAEVVELGGPDRRIRSK